MTSTLEFLLAAIRRRAGNPDTRTDQTDVVSTEVAARVSAAQVAHAELELGFALPPLLAAVYTHIGNGGFGPGYGIIGLPGGFTDDQGHSIVGRYAAFREPDPNDPAWQWPARLVPVCHWGCAIYSCVDCTVEAGPVLVWDPNVWDEGSSPGSTLRAAAGSLEDWLGDWARGVNLWEKMFPADA